jgi:hypothetical protein
MARHTITQTVTMTFEDDYNNFETQANIAGLLQELLEAYQGDQKADRIDSEIAGVSGPTQEQLISFIVT